MRPLAPCHVSRLITFAGSFASLIAVSRSPAGRVLQQYASGGARDRPLQLNANQVTSAWALYEKGDATVVGRVFGVSGTTIYRRLGRADATHSPTKWSRADP